MNFLYDLPDIFVTPFGNSQRRSLPVCCQVDANWGIHAIMKKSLFSKKSASKFGRRLMGDDTTGKSVVQLMADWKAARESQAEL